MDEFYDWFSSDGTPPALLLDPADTTSAPGSVLDSGGAHGTDWGAIAAGGLSKLLDVFATTQAAKSVATYGVAPGYTRIPGTNQVVPVGTYQAQTQSSNTSMLLMIALIVGAVMLLTRKG